jgi:glutathionyl-hydroquinone reductase
MFEEYAELLGIDDWRNELFPNEQEYIESLPEQLLLHPNMSVARVMYHLTDRMDRSKNSRYYKLVERTLLYAEKIATDDLDLHYIYTRLAEFYYRYNELFDCERYCLKDLGIIQKYISDVFEFLDKRVPDILTLERLTILYDKEGRYQEAMPLCELGILLHLDGYEERKKRIEKKIKMKVELLEG